MHAEAKGESAAGCRKATPCAVTHYGVMPHYRLNIYNGNGDTPDAEGHDFPDQAAARDQAIAGIRSLLSEEALAGTIDLCGRIEIVADDGAIVAVVPFTDAVAIRSPRSPD